MPGFGSGPFGTGGFGEWPWSLFMIVQGIPSVYKDQDQLAGDGTLQALLEGLAPSMDAVRRKVRDYDILRDPLEAPIEQSFLVAQTILRTEAQDDGTSLVFLSEGPDGDRFDGLAPGQTLLDFRGLRFVICRVAKSTLNTEVSNPPTDPATGLPTGKHIVVNNIGQASTEFIPFVSGTFVSQENPAVDEATGTIVAIAPGSLIDGESFTLHDGVAASSVTFEFDTVPDGVTPGNVAVDTSTAIDDIQVATAMVAAINAETSLNLVADNVSGTVATVTIANPGTGAEGNDGAPGFLSWSDTVIDAGFIITQPTGGGPGAYIVESGSTLVDDGLRTPPYVFNVESSYIGGLNIALNRVTVQWSEGGLRKEGFFTNAEAPGGDLADTSVIDFSAGAVGTGQIRMFNDSGTAVDANSITVTYTQDDTSPPEDAEVRAQNILAFLANDVNIRLDRNDPEFLQRSYVNSAWKIWNIKGTELGYDVLGQYAGYFVSAAPLYAVIESIALGLPQQEVFEFPAGTSATGSIVTIPAVNLFDGETFFLDDGINTPVTFEFDNVPDGVAGGNVVVDISAAVTSIDVADAIVLAINGTGSLNLNANNSSGTTNIVTIVNTVTGEVGNVVTWGDTVANGGFIVANPTGGTNGQLFTTVDPGRPQFDEIILDALPLDLICSEDAFPETVQAVTATSVELIREEGSNKRTIVTVTATSMEESFGTEGIFTDIGGTDFVIESFQRIDSSTYSFETSNFVVPTTGAGTVAWKVFKFEAPNIVTIIGVGTDVVDLGRQSIGYTGRRYRVTKTFTDPPLAGVGNWVFIDSEGVRSYIETFEETETPGEYAFEIISGTPPAIGSAHIFLACEIVTDCDFCRASSLFVRISPTTILDFPDALEGDALSRLIIRLEKMIPGHVRIAAFVFDPGPAIAPWGAIAASSTVEELVEDDALWTAFYDEDEFPADEIPADSAPIVAGSTVQEEGDPDNSFGPVLATDDNIFEEFIDGSDPIISGAWTATGLWHVTEYRSSTQYRSFSYGQGDSGRVGEGGAVAPNYDTGGIIALGDGILTSPVITDPGPAPGTITSMTLRFRVCTDYRANPDDTPEVRVGGLTFSDSDMGITGAQTLVPAWGCIYVAEQSAYTDGQTFDLDDGVNPATTFEFDVAGNGVGGGNVAINISGDTDPDEVRDTIIAAINGVAGSLAVTASPGGAAEVKLLNDSTGVAGNVAITTTGSPPGTFIGMQGGGLGFITVSLDITAVGGTGDFTIAFDFASVSTTLAEPGEGWYVDDVEVQVVYP